MGPSGRIGHILYILDCLGQVYAGLYWGRAPRTKETLPDFLKWGRVTRPPLVFRGLTGSQRTPGFWGVTLTLESTPSLTIGGRCTSKRWRSFDPPWLTIAHAYAIAATVIPMASTKACWSKADGA